MRLPSRRIVSSPCMSLPYGGVSYPLCLVICSGLKSLGLCGGGSLSRTSKLDAGDTLGQYSACGRQCSHISGKASGLRTPGESEQHAHVANERGQGRWEVP